MDLMHDVMLLLNHYLFVMVH